MLALYSPRPMTVTDGPPTVYDYLAWYLVEIYRLMSALVSEIPHHVFFKAIPSPFGTLALLLVVPVLLVSTVSAYRRHLRPFATVFDALWFTLSIISFVICAKTFYEGVLCPAIPIDIECKVLL